jgi:hypothetical protein
MNDIYFIEAVFERLSKNLLVKSDEIELALDKIENTLTDKSFDCHRFSLIHGRLSQELELIKGVVPL